jgi:pimeloyl-ACP methyl ester carboxylesterase
MEDSSTFTTNDDWKSSKVEGITSLPIDEGNAKIAYELYGSADAPEKIVFITGFGVKKSAWEVLLPYLLSIKRPSDSSSASESTSSSATLFQIVLYDNRGSDKSTAIPGRYTSSLLAKDILHLLNHLHFSKVHIIGASMVAFLFLFFLPVHFSSISFSFFVLC